MKKLFGLLTMSVVVFSCAEKRTPNNFSSVKVDTVYEDSISIRAIEFLDESTLAFAGNKGFFGSVEVKMGKVRLNAQKYDTIVPEFRAIAHTSTDFFMLSVANPALLYKTESGGQMKLVYKEEGEGVFYDAMKFWNDDEGVAVGDIVDGCISIVITRDGGSTWRKIPCSDLPNGVKGEGAFAASNTNIETNGDAAWIATSAGRVYHSLDKGKTWDVVQTPIINEGPAQGIYSIDFYDEKQGYGVGGDYTQPELKTANKIVTNDGGKSWQLIADDKAPNYKSCVQYVPNSDGKELVALGFTGVSYSHDGGANWEHLSDESFYTLRFLNDSVAYAAGKNRIAKLSFR